MCTREALLWLITTEEEWLRAFKAFCEQGSFRLRSQAWQFCDELKDQGCHFPTEEVEDALFGLARVLLPESPAARWDTEWAGELASKALRCLAEFYVKGADLSVLDPWEDKADEAALAEDRRAYREAWRGYMHAGLKAFAAAKRGAA